MEIIKKFKVIILLVLIVSAGFIVYNFPMTEAQKLDKKCKDLGLTTVQDEEKKYGADFKFKDIQTFYSKTLNTCVQSRIDELDNASLIRDIARNFIKDNLEGGAVTDVASYYGKTSNNLFYCDEGGVDNTRLDVVRAHDGYVSSVPYKELMDDFNGGPSRAVKTPDKKFTKDDCGKLFEKKMKEIK